MKRSHETVLTIAGIAALLCLAMAGDGGAVVQPSARSSNWAPTALFAAPGAGSSELPGLSSGRTMMSVLGEDGDWTSVPPPTTLPDRVCAAIVYDWVNGKVYMAGGTEAGAANAELSNFQRFDPVLNTWTDMAPMPAGRTWLDGQGSFVPGLGAAGKIYIMCGMTGSGISNNNCWEYDIATNVWATKANAPVAQLAHASGIWRDSLIYILGGYGSGSGSNAVQIYDPYENTWTLGTPMPENSDMFSATIIGDTIYITNGLNRSTSETWTNGRKGAINPADPTQVTWSDWTGLPFVGFNGGTAKLGTKLYRVGGFGTIYYGSEHRRGFSYDPITAVIETIPWLPNPPYSAGLARCNFLIGCEATSEVMVFGGDANPDMGFSKPNNYYFRNQFTPPHNITCWRMLSPSGAMDSGVTITPQVITRNTGSFTEDYKVFLSIPEGFGYLDSAELLGVPAGRIDTISFMPWTPHARDSMSATAYTVCAEDPLPTDDTIKTRFLVRVRDVAVTQILAPKDTLDSAVVVFPQARVWNYGNQSATFNLEFRIGAYVNTVTVSNLLAGGARTVTATAPLTTQPGTWVHRVEAILSGDLHPENNVLTDTFWVRGTVSHDVAAEAILSPLGRIDTSTVAVRARVGNYGGASETFWSWFTAWDPTTDARVYHESLQVSLPGGANTTVSFPDAKFAILGKYTSRCSVYVAGDQNALNNVKRDSFEVSEQTWVNNVLVQEILAPVGTIDSNDLVTPSAVVQNAGSVAATFNTYMRIGGYLASANVANLAPGGTRTVTFTNWRANTKDTTEAVCWTLLTGDENPADDTLREKFFVAIHDVGVQEIVFPVDTLPADTVIYPSCIVRNYGSATESFDVKFYIGMYQGTATVSDLDPGMTQEVEAAEPYTTQVGIWLTRAETELAGDMRAANNVARDTFWVLGTVEYDVAVTEILAPTGTIDTMTTVEPKVEVANLGSNTETWMTYFKVYHKATGALVYDKEQETTLPPAAEQVLTFPDTKFTTLGVHVIRCSTYLATDQNWTNNVATDEFEVGDVTTWDRGWKEMKSLPAPNSGKPVKDGAWLAMDGNRTIYAAKGYKTADFYSYDAITNTWKPLKEIPSDEGGRVKLPNKGSTGVSDGGDNVYMVKGNNTLGFWRYSVSADSWYKLTDIPVGPNNKKVKGGSDVAYVEKGGTGYVYLLKGYKTEFYRYNVTSGEWLAMPDVPYADRPKYDKGSWMAFSPGDVTPAPKLYVHQAKYINRTAGHHNMFVYDADGDTWVPGVKKGMPVAGLHAGRTKNKKSKDGGSGVFSGENIFALKGGNTQQFFRYAVGGDSWFELDTMPRIGTTGKKKYVKAGADLVSYGGYGAFFAFKGNKTAEFWRYVHRSDIVTGRPDRPGVMAGMSAKPASFSVAPNPLTAGFATVRFSLPVSGPVSVTVFDVAGRSVFSTRSLGHLTTGSLPLDLRKLSSGVYLVRLDAEGTSQTQKLVVQK